MKFSEFNKYARLLTLAGICIGLYAIIASGTILTFLHPRSLPLVKIAWVVLVALTLSDLRTFTSAKGSTKLDWRFFALFFPLVLAVSVKPSGLSSRMAMQKGLSSLALTMQSDQKRKENRTDDHSWITLDNDSLRRDSLLKREMADPLCKDTSLKEPAPQVSRMSMVDTIREDSMYAKIDEIYSNLAPHKGQLITMTGFIAPDTVLGRYSFFIARMMVTCCAADAMPLGFYCSTKSTLGVSENEWVVLTGKVEPRTVKFPWDKSKQTIPILQVVSARKTAAPANQYIYPVY